jgi:hypothetical protein
MKRNIFYILKVLIFALIVGVVVAFVNFIELPKYLYDSKWATTATYVGFYKIPKDSVDVLILGSSHAATGISPQKLYDEYGITSYNLGCEQQNLLVSYYWLKEALKYQSPKAVIIDTYMLQTYNNSEPLNTAESCTRKAIDYMRWGDVKFRAIKDICKHDTNQNIWSYYLTNLRFHTRWTWLNDSDFTFNEMKDHYELKGYIPLYISDGSSNYTAFSSDINKGKNELNTLMVEYMQKIVNLCRKNNIELIMIKTPTTRTNIKWHNAVQNFADKNHVNFYDLNENNKYQQLGFDFATDMYDHGHSNVSGSIKITRYIGNMLQNQLDLLPKMSDAWEATEEYWDEVQTIYLLLRETDLIKYLRELNLERFSIFMAANADTMNGLNQETVDSIRKLGFNVDLGCNSNCNYIAVKTPEGIFETASDGEIIRNDTYNNGRLGYTITIGKDDSGNEISICLDGTDYSLQNQQGINIVVYDNISQDVIDSVCFDISSDDMTTYR